ncbi:unnamed protein product [Moneuplotes crassus]|uniref:Regulator of chromosome condensation n=1 Tax=Euplotes crassus TaxID=5936 RepID=A0AAD1XBF8_EUPCR|nr:unnamed protein product [Moneuplotes crassus]
MSEIYYFGDPKLKPKDDQAYWYKVPQLESATSTDEKLREKFYKVEVDRQEIKSREEEEEEEEESSDEDDSDIKRMMKSKKTILDEIDQEEIITVKDIRCGEGTVYILMINGELYAFGKGTQGQIGNRSVIYKQKSTARVYFKKPVMTIDSGETHTAIIDKDGDCYVWGSVTNKKLGLSQTSADGIFTKPMRLTTLNKERKALKEKEIAEKAALKKKKKKRKKSEYVPVGLANYEGVACGTYNTLFLISGNVYSVGAKEKGVLGYQTPGSEGSPLPIYSLNSMKIEGVCAGQSHCLAWSSSGKLFSWGKVSEGCLGYMNQDKSDIQVEPRVIEALSEYDICYSCCGIRRSMALTTCGRVFSWGKGDREMSLNQDDYYKPMNLFDSKQFKNSSDLSFVQIACGPTHCGALTSSGVLYMWGDLKHGCQGNFTSDGKSKKHSYLPQHVNYFTNSKLKIYKVACGDCFTVVATVENKNFMAVKKYMKPTSSDHISVALKKKLQRRMEFSKFKKQFLSQRKLKSSTTLNSNTLKSSNDINLYDMNSGGMDLDFLQPIVTTQRLPPPKKVDCIEEYSKEKYEELKSNPKISEYFKEMLSNPKKFKGSKGRSNTRNSKRSIFSSEVPHVKPSGSIFVKKSKCMEENFPEKARKSKSKDGFFIKEFFQNLYNNNLTKVYDPITEVIYDDNKEGDLVNKSFYYFNMQKDQEDYVRDLQLKAQEKLANKNQNMITSNSIRMFRKNQGQYSLMDAQSEFNKYPNLNPYKANLETEVGLKFMNDMNIVEMDKTPAVRMNSPELESRFPLSPPRTSRGQRPNFFTGRSSKSMKKYRRQCAVIRKHQIQTQEVLKRKDRRAKIELESSRQKYNRKMAKLKAAEARKNKVFLDIQASALINKYKGIDNLLKEHEKRPMEKKMINYCVFQYLLALKQYYGHIHLLDFLKFFSRILLLKINEKREQEKLIEMKKLEEEEKIKAKNEQMQEEINNTLKEQGLR